jgi:hypothetical protein
MPLFQPDEVLPHDPAGWGRWLQGHSLEHAQFVALAQMTNPPFSIPQYDIFGWSDEPFRQVFWKNIHQQIHQSLRNATGLTGIDYSLIDFNDDDSFLLWQSDHAQEHSDLRAYYGIS